MNRTRTVQLTQTALMAAMVFLATNLIRFPNPATGGYSHLGDCMVFLAVLILGRNRGATAAGIGGAMSDLLAGAPVWILPTLVIKFTMAFIMGSVSDDGRGSTLRLTVASVLGGIFQIIAYTLVKVVLFGWRVALVSVPNLTIQTTIGIVLFVIIGRILERYAPRLTRRA
ncbi:MAG: ECF transporter S component [Anaerovoracaceae bacterium]|jgi:uncharacterized membrane protein